MTALKVFSDSPLDAATTRLLLDGTAPYEVLFPRTAASSVLAQADPDLAFPLADIAFGQPDLESIRRSDRLKWIHLSSAGFTRYDTPEFRALVAERGVVVTHSSSVYAAACAEHVFALMLAHSRRLPQALRSQAASGAAERFQQRGDTVSLRAGEIVSAV